MLWLLVKKKSRCTKNIVDLYVKERAGVFKKKDFLLVFPMYKQCYGY